MQKRNVILSVASALLVATVGAVVVKLVFHRPSIQVGHSIEDPVVRAELERLFTKYGVTFTRIGPDVTTTVRKSVDATIAIHVSLPYRIVIADPTSPNYVGAIEEFYAWRASRQ
jgi:hypothetical protein